ncbi:MULTISPECIES: hypothetical protein [Aphanizomenonaceae]|uniref:Uncharacterized protein n=1 Tax=Dolichospermum heterosporum TAC447 TaxID=747523 RepID=A0ABY5M0W9_9CYAN|nr:MULTISPECIES: hypothetical protein [Aphanizomenonaceae]UUO16498.1 hypothetical protein NG743_05520 [Dolichospermum heterosporum TAC447]
MANATLSYQESKRMPIVTLINCFFYCLILWRSHRIIAHIGDKSMRSLII